MIHINIDGMPAPMAIFSIRSLQQLLHTGEDEHVVSKLVGETIREYRVLWHNATCSRETIDLRCNCTVLLHATGPRAPARGLSWWGVIGVGVFAFAAGQLFGSLFPL